MVIFNTVRMKIYCKIIHNYLEAEIFGDSKIDIGDALELFMPKYLFREQYQKCIEIIKELYEWTDDLFLHELNAFHEITLYYFLKEMKNIKEDMQEEFINIYYDKELKNEITKYAKEEKGTEGEFTIEELEASYYDPDDIIANIFEDIDFVELPYLYNEQKNDIPILAEQLGINLDYYFEILPIDIQKQ